MQRSAVVRIEVCRACVGRRWQHHLNMQVALKCLAHEQEVCATGNADNHSQLGVRKMLFEIGQECRQRVPQSRHAGRVELAMAEDSQDQWRFAVRTRSDRVRSAETHRRRESRVV